MRYRNRKDYILTHKSALTGKLKGLYSPSISDDEESDLDDDAGRKLPSTFMKKTIYQKDETVGCKNNRYKTPCMRLERRDL